jgi:hypothetical protein
MQQSSWRPNDKRLGTWQSNAKMVSFLAGEILAKRVRGSKSWRFVARKTGRLHSSSPPEVEISDLCIKMVYVRINHSTN